MALDVCTSRQLVGASKPSRISIVVPASSHAARRDFALGRTNNDAETGSTRAVRISDGSAA